MPKTKPAPGQSAVRRCECGCGGETKGGKFLIGHDAKLKSRLINTVLDEAKPKPEREKAEGELRDRGWLAHLEKSRDSRRRKSERATEGLDRLDDRPRKARTEGRPEEITRDDLEEPKSVSDGATVYFPQGSGFKAGTVVGFEDGEDDTGLVIVLYGNAQGNAVQKRVPRSEVLIKKAE